MGCFVLLNLLLLFLKLAWCSMLLFLFIDRTSGVPFETILTVTMINTHHVEIFNAKYGSVDKVASDMMYEPWMMSYSLHCSLLFLQNMFYPINIARSY